MTKQWYAKDIGPGIVGRDELFSVKEIQKHKAKNGDPYFRLILKDKSGAISAKIWKDSFISCNADTIIAGDAVIIDFESSEFNNEIQLTIKKMRKVTDYPVHELVQSTTKNLDEMWSQLLTYAKNIEDVDIRNLITTILQDDSIAPMYKQSAAAEMVHHDFVGGLLEHVLEMLALAKTSVDLYPIANRSIVYAGVIMHDIGKIYEFALDNTTTIRTKVGYLKGHIVLGVEILQRFVQKSFPEAKKLAIEHIILSHHEEPEFGAVVRPATIEAIIVASVDRTSSLIRQFHKELTQGSPDLHGFGAHHKFAKTRIYHADYLDTQSGTNVIKISE